ncbi:alpha/beta hydrolase family esterase [Pseudonocardia spinosispora]|uniref:alpha/beta hydrolase family esterase n=1 Tax=Pseudonocardia spinosispora TaxID=103441 RepID=UPI0012EC78ED|nr:PHB depolymerase family esterase [Pseudonocardia spinosispora]
MRVAAVRWTGVVAVVVALLSACTVLTACAEPPPKPVAAAPLPANRTVTLATPSGPRTAIVHHPAGRPRNLPLVVVIHGAYGSAEQTKASFGWDSLADREGFVVAYPNGMNHFWNAGYCCGAPHTKNIDDVAFLHQLRDRLIAQDGVDPKRVYAVGMSNGAMMTYAWACARPSDLAGIGPVAGALVAQCDPAPAITVVAIHGTADRNVPINGGVGPRSVSHYDYPSLASTLSPFVAADGCNPMPVNTDRPPVRFSTWTCAGDRNVLLAVVNGMGHDWPGSRPADTVKRVLRQAPGPLDATTFLWTNLRSSVLG